MSMPLARAPLEELGVAVGPCVGLSGLSALSLSALSLSRRRSVVALVHPLASTDREPAAQAVKLTVTDRQTAVCQVML